MTIGGGARTPAVFYGSLGSDTGSALSGGATRLWACKKASCMCGYGTLWLAVASWRKRCVPRRYRIPALSPVMRDARFLDPQNDAALCLGALTGFPAGQGAALKGVAALLFVRVGRFPYGGNKRNGVRKQDASMRGNRYGWKGVDGGRGDP